MHARTISFTPVPVAFRIACRTTVEQDRKMYLAGRRSWEERLAAQWRESHAWCDRCGYVGSDHALWCPYTD